MDKIKIRYCDYEEICRRFDWMEIEDCDFYAPSIEELKTILFPNIRENNYLLFLLWIEETGIKTEENKKARAEIRKFIYTILEFVGEEEEGEDFCLVSFSDALPRIIFDEKTLENNLAIFRELTPDGTYAPGIGVINSRILKNIKKYSLYLLHIIETGIETEKNKDARKYIRQILERHVDIL